MCLCVCLQSICVFLSSAAVVPSVLSHCLVSFNLLTLHYVGLFKWSQFSSVPIYLKQSEMLSEAAGSRLPITVQIACGGSQDKRKVVFNQTPQGKGVTSLFYLFIPPPLICVASH